MSATVFETLNSINVNDKTETKKSGNDELTYLSWTWAWAEVKSRYPEAHYEIVMHDGLPYVYDENTGYMVFTTVTIDGITHMMWLPVMDGANKAMKNQPYTYKVKNQSFRYAKFNKEDGKYYDNYGNEQPEYLEKRVAGATMFDINKTIMRCLVKNLAMFGLGLYIYAGEDLPEVEAEEQKAKQEEQNRKQAEEEKKQAEEEKAKQEQEKKQAEETAAKMVKDLRKAFKDKGIDEKFVLGLYKLKDLKDVDQRKHDNIMSHLDDIKKKQEEKGNE